METRSEETSSVFVNLFLMALAWRIVTLVPDSLVATGIGAVFALSGTMELVGHFNRLLRMRRAHSLTFVPPLWLVGWVALVAVATLFGTPHVTFSENRNACAYFGWNGVVRTPPPCPTLRFFPTSDQPVQPDNGIRYRLISNPANQ
ncbi:hypothetical protein M2352_003703 [Azospirillum fermentarium]|uniref:hypothetical protein n=1 Tax=Azospirillum fermentarium TaxID=1233114 RepID=UPI002225E698|nr:hypothetical protein [Azospirillum fermentarium]MCW2248069.1 hypothetical protein [Azospirillum fermentarium]